MNEKIPTKVENFEEIIDKELTIPPYQRPYTWGVKNIDKMIEDFGEFLENMNENSQYYMGSLLLHQEGDKFNIVDGQQRVTSLMLLAIVLELQEYHREISYDNQLSQKQIKSNYDYLLKKKEAFESIKMIFEKLCFTVVIVDNVDDAFTFFDTQNSRGVQPSVLVLLKAFNLRCITLKETQVQVAKDWDKHERHRVYHLAEKSDKLEWLIKILFYRVRNWRGDKKADFGSYEQFRDSFTKEMRTVSKVENCFAVRRPLYQGEDFFQFINHYAKLLDDLMTIEIHNGKDFKELLAVHRIGSIYMESFLSMLTLVYYDRFGQENISEFVKNINDILVDIRLGSSRILKQTLEIHFIRAENKYIKQNILDFISSAFDTQEVMEWLGKAEIIEYKDLSGVREKFDTKNKEFWGIQK